MGWRVYPICCTSAYCGTGGDACLTCRNYPKLKEFKEWVARTEAEVSDPIWSPLVYVPKREDPEAA